MYLWLQSDGINVTNMINRYKQSQYWEGVFFFFFFFFFSERVFPLQTLTFQSKQIARCLDEFRPKWQVVCPPFMMCSPPSANTNSATASWTALGWQVVAVSFFFQALFSFIAQFLNL